MIRSQPLEMDPELLDLISEWERARDLGQPRQPEDLCAESPEWLSLLRVWITQLTAFDRQFSDNRPRSDHNTEQTELSLPGFEILEEIGRGGMGIVYKARQISLDRLVAVKMINGRIWGNANLVARLRSEAAALARLKHEHVIQVHDVI